MDAFNGFTAKALTLLMTIKENNSKPWFEEHRADYEKLLLQPFRQLVTELAPMMLSIDAQFEVKPAVNKTLSRIFRDTRFSKDKSLFRDSMWLTFKRPGQDWSSMIPGYFFELSPNGYRYGMGFYAAAPKVMAALREKIDEHPQAFLSAVHFMQQDAPFSLEGEDYKRTVENEHTDVMQPWYQKKSFYLVCNRQPDDLLFSHALPDVLWNDFQQTKDLYAFLVSD